MLPLPQLIPAVRVGELRGTCLSRAFSHFFSLSFSDRKAKLRGRAGVNLAAGSSAGSRA